MNVSTYLAGVSGFFGAIFVMALARMHLPESLGGQDATSSKLRVLIGDLADRITYLESEIVRLGGVTRRVEPTAEAFDAAQDQVVDLEASPPAGQPAQSYGSLPRPSEGWEPGAATPASGFKVRAPEWDEAQARPANLGPPKPKRSNLVGQFETQPAVSRLMAAYGQLMTSAAAMAAFEAEYRPVSVALRQGRLTTAHQDVGAPFWFIGSVSPDGLIGALLPARMAIQQWGERYQYLDGKAAREIFGCAYAVEKGDTLNVVTPAWARLTDSTTYEVVHSGQLRGA